MCLPDITGAVLFRVGARLSTANGDLIVAGTLYDCPFDRGKSDWTLICSEETFSALAGESGYTILDIQLDRSADDDDVNAIRQLAGGYAFSDQRPQQPGGGGSLLLLRPLRLRIPRHHRPDRRLQHHQQYLHERLGAHPPVRRHAGRGNGNPAAHPDDRRGNFRLRGLRYLMRQRRRTAAPPLSVAAVHLRQVEGALAISSGRLCGHHRRHHPLRHGSSIRPGEADTGNVRG